MLKRILPLLLVLMLMLTGCGKSDADTPNNTYEKISMSEGLKRMESDENYILLDVRRADEFEAGHIPGAVNLPLLFFQISTQELYIQDKVPVPVRRCRRNRRSCKPRCLYPQAFFLPRSDNGLQEKKAYG